MNHDALNHYNANHWLQLCHWTSFFSAFSGTPTLWELPHNAQNITLFGHSPDINDPHTIINSALLHHHTTLLYLV